MKYLKINENVNNNEVNFTSKVDKLEGIKNEINAFLSAYGKQIGFNYAIGNKGFYFLTNEGELIDNNGYACTTFNELCSNLEAILYTVKSINTTPIETSAIEEPIENIEILDTQIDTPPIDDEVLDQEEPVEDILKFESFQNK